MKRELGMEVEGCRVAGVSGSGPYGKFLLLCPVTGRRLVVVASDGRDWLEEGLVLPVWEHVSVSGEYGCPTWLEMAWVKGVFWGPEECVVEFHVPAAEHVNCHPYCLHLWRVVGVDFPRPPLATV